MVEKKKIKKHLWSNILDSILEEANKQQQQGFFLSISQVPTQPNFLPTSEIKLLVMITK